MTKRIFVARSVERDFTAFQKRVMEQAVPRLKACEPSRLSVVLTEHEPPKALFGFRQQPVATFDVESEGGPEPYYAALHGLGFEVSGYEVEESTPVAYQRTWRDGEPTPSPILLTVLHRKQGLPDAEFIERWHGGHTPLSLKIHPLWYYERNVVRRALGNSPSCDGIVYEACRDRADLLNPRRFFGGALMMLPNMIRVWFDIKGFLDTARIETYLATQYHVVS